MNNNFIIIFLSFIITISISFIGCKKVDEKKVAEPSASSLATPLSTSSGSAEQPVNAITTIVTNIEKAPDETGYYIDTKNGAFFLPVNADDFTNVVNILIKSKTNQLTVILIIKEMGEISKAKFEQN